MASLEIRVKVAAYQAPLASCDTPAAGRLLGEQVRRCEAIGVELLCCPEGLLGGLADYSDRPVSLGINVGSGQLHAALAPLASGVVTSVVGFTEIDAEGRLFNAAAVVHRGQVLGVYRKHHPAINRSVYQAGCEVPVFTTGRLTFGVLICRDSSFPELAAAMVSQGAAALLVPTNNGMPAAKGGPELIAEARSSDIARAIESGVAVIRADVAGRTRERVSYGSSGIVDQHGIVLGAAQQLEADLVVAEIGVTRHTAPAMLA